MVATHLTKIVRENASDLLSRQAVSELLDKLKTTEPTVISELVPHLLNVGAVHRVLQLLLSEQIPIHDLSTILETLADHAGQSKDPLTLSELCRQSMRGHVLARHLSESGCLYAFILGPGLEDELQQSTTRGGRPGVLNLSPERAESLVQRLQAVFENCRMGTDAIPVLLVTPSIRPHLARLVHRKVQDLDVLSYAEIMDEVNLRIVGNVEASELNGAVAA